MSNSLELKQNSARWLTFELTDENGQAVDLTGCTFSYRLKRFKEDDSPLISKSNEDFDKDEASQGRVRVFLSSTDLDLDPDNYVGELKINFPGGDVFISEDLDLQILMSVH